MLTKFEVQNFKSFKDSFVFDLSETKNYEFNSKCLSNGIVNKALIYGANGCGKSNLGFAIFDLVSHLTDKQFNPENYRNYLNAESEEVAARFVYSFRFDESVLEYSYGKIAFGSIAWERLTINGDDIVIYHYGEPIQINLKGTETLNTDLSGSKISAIKYIKNNAVLKKNKTNDVFKAFLSFVDSMLFFRCLEVNYYLGYQTENNSITEDILQKGHLCEFEAFLNKAGVDCKLGLVESNGKEDIAFMFGEKSLAFWDAASSGTRSLTLFYYWLQRLREESSVSFVFIDEFDAYYHHKLSKLIVTELKTIQSQVILTTHNTSIMSNDLLRPDCYFLMQNNKIQPLYKFTDKELRNAHNIEKMYKAGAFDG